METHHSTSKKLKKSGHENRLAKARREKDERKLSETMLTFLMKEPTSTVVATICSDAVHNNTVCHESSLTVEKSPELETTIACSDIPMADESADLDGSHSVSLSETSEICFATTPTSSQSTEAASVNLTKTCVENAALVRSVAFKTPTTTESSRAQLDIGSLQREKLTDAEKLLILERGDIPLRHNLPTRDCGKKKRKFNPDFLSTYKWLRYSNMLDGCFCVACFLFSSTQGVFVTSPFTDWSNTSAVMQKHQESVDHSKAAQSCISFTAITSGKQQTVCQSISSAFQETIARNRHVLGEIVKVIILCGKQNIPLRGHIPETSNFHSILHLLREHDPILDNFLKTSPRNAQYISPKIQNEFIQLIGQQIQRSILAEVREAKWFGLIADETPDVSRIEQVSLSVRYLTASSQVKEMFLEFIQSEDTRGVSLANQFLQRISAWNLDKKNLRAQAYDKGANMSGKFKGVQAAIRKELPEAVYCACLAHGLNTAIVHSCGIASVSNLLTKANEAIRMTKSSAKRHNIYKEELKKLSHFIPDDDNTLEIPLACDTRWISQAGCLQSLKDKFVIVVSALEAISDFDVKATSVLHSILQFDFIVPLFVVEDVLGYTVNLHKTLQKVNVDLVNAVDDAEAVVRCLEDIRNEDYFSSLYISAKKLAADVDVEEKVPRITKRQIHRANADSMDPRQHYYRNLFLPFVDNMIVELKEQLIQPKPRFLAQYLIPSRLSKCSRDLEKDIFAAFTSDCVYDEKEMKIWRSKWSSTSDREKPASVCETLAVMSRDTFPNIYTALSIFATMPVSVATAERSFSTLKRLKTWLRNTMGESRLTGLALMHLHRDVNIDIEQVLRDFDPLNDRRILLALN